MTLQPTLHPQLEAIRQDFAAAQQRLHAVVQTVPLEHWPRRPDPARWSIAECVAHLNLTGAAYLPLLRAALERGRQLGAAASKRYRRDPVGWLMWRLAGPPVRHKMKTVAAFIPSGNQRASELIREFDGLQAAQMNFVVEANGLKLERMWIRSPFNAKVQYNLYSCLTILPRHQHRHLWQAEQVWAALRQADG